MPNWKKVVVSGSDAVLNGLEVTNDITSSGLLTNNFAVNDTLGIGAQTFYAHGADGFSVNEDFNAGGSNQTAYHFTSGDVNRTSVAFSLARTTQFTNMFGVTGSSSDNKFVIGGEFGNTDFEWRTGLGISPIQLQGGTLLARLNRSGSLYVSNSITGSDITIDDWGSVSASLASIEATVPTLQQVTDEGSTTTNNIKIGNSITFDEGFETTTAISSSGGKLFVTTWDEVVGFNTTTPDLLQASAGGIHVNKNTGGQASIRLTVSNTGSSGGSIITHNVTAGNDLYIQNRASGSIFLGTNVASTGVNQFTLDESGNFSVSGATNSFGNTSNPATRLVIYNTNTSPGVIFFNDGGTTINGSPGFIKYDHTNNSFSVGTNTFTGLTLDTDRKLRLNAYGGGTVTGTAAYNLSVDSSGNVIETTTPTLQQVTDSGFTTTNSITVDGSTIGGDIIATNLSASNNLYIEGSTVSKQRVLVVDNDSYTFFSPDLNDDYYGGVIEYTLFTSSKTNLRTGTIMWVANSSEVSHTETTTAGIGNTSAAVISSSISGTSVLFTLTNDTGAGVYISWHTRLNAFPGV